MEVYTLDDRLRRETVIDRFESLIWTERFSAYGDFQIVTQSTIPNKNLLARGTMLATNTSNRIMIVENVEDKEDSEGRMLLTVSGRSLESILENRVNRSGPFNTGGPDTGSEIRTGTPGDICRLLFDAHCRTNVGIPQDNIPFLVTGSLYPQDTIAEPDQVITIEVKNASIYTSVKEICEIYGLGFRLYRGSDNSRLYFDIYSGNDRTTSQSTLPAVIFSPDLENLTNITEFSSIEGLKNVAYVRSDNGTRIVYSLDASENTNGFDRRVLYVDASDVDLPAGAELQDELERIGKEELAKNRAITAIDGELRQNSRYRYEVDYFLGDLIEIRNDAGVANRMRVTEQIFVDDSQGERSYPTLAYDLFITPGSWYAWDFSGVWDEAEGVWDDA